MAKINETAHYDGPPGGWSSLCRITSIFGKDEVTPLAIETLMRQNKLGGFI